MQLAPTVTLRTVSTSCSMSERMYEMNVNNYELRKCLVWFLHVSHTQQKAQLSFVRAVFAEAAFS